MSSYEEILKNMKDKYIELTGVSVPEASDIDIRMKVLAGEIYKEQVNLEFIKNQMFVETASGKYLDYHGLERGLKRRPAVKAVGRVRFSVLVPLEKDLLIPKGTVVSTVGDVLLRYYTDNNVVIKAGTTSVTVDCTAEKAGSASNILIGYVTELVSVVTGIDTVTNPTAFIGGVNEESDDAFRKRIIESYENVSTGTNAAYYKNLALSFDEVDGAGVLEQSDGIGTVGVYISSKGYPAGNTLIKQVQMLMDQERELNVSVKVYPAQKILVSFHLKIKVIDGFDYMIVTDNVKTAIREYVATLNVGESVYGSMITRVVLDVEGIKSCSLGTFYDNDYILTPSQFPAADEILVEVSK